MIVDAVMVPVSTVLASEETPRGKFVAAVNKVRSLLSRDPADPMVHYRSLRLPRKQFTKALSTFCSSTNDVVEREVRAARILDTEYWPEFFDAKHRSRDVLGPLFKIWKDQQLHTKVSFWEMIEALENNSDQHQLPPLFQAKQIVLIGNDALTLLFRAKALQSEGVRYMTPQERETYRIQFKMTPTGEVGVYDSAGNPLPFSNKFMVVLGKNQEFYGCDKGKVQRCFHASFFAGKPVLAAGYISVMSGKLREFAAHSGHYQPGDYAVNQFFLQLDKLNLRLHSVSLCYYVMRHKKITTFGWDNAHQWHNFFPANRHYDLEDEFFRTNMKFHSSCRVIS